MRNRLCPVCYAPVMRDNHVQIQFRPSAAKELPLCIISDLTWEWEPNYPLSANKPTYATRADSNSPSTTCTNCNLFASMHATTEPASNKRRCTFLPSGEVVGKRTTVVPSKGVTLAAAHGGLRANRSGVLSSSRSARANAHGSASMARRFFLSGMKQARKSMGSGKMMVEFFSAEMVFSV